MSDGVEIYYGKGTTPERVAREMERAKESRNRDKPAVSTAKREAFFANLAELRKRAES